MKMNCVMRGAWCVKYLPDEGCQYTEHAPRNTT
jgi:hypothetical protein